ILLLSVALPAAAQLEVTYGAKTITIQGAHPHARIAVCGAMNGHYDGREVVSTYQSLGHADAQGTLTVEVSKPSFRSVWLVVDITGGTSTISSPPGYTARRVDMPTDAFSSDGTRIAHGRP